jgi:hypothetical protein
MINAHYNQRHFTLLELTTKYEANTCVALTNAFHCVAYIVADQSQHLGLTFYRYPIKPSAGLFILIKSRESITLIRFTRFEIQ